MRWRGLAKAALQVRLMPIEVAVLVARREHQHPEAQDFLHALQGAGWIAGIVDAGRQPVGHTQPSFHLAQCQQSGIRRQRAAVAMGRQRLAVHWQQARQRRRSLGSGGRGPVDPEFLA